MKARQLRDLGIPPGRLMKLALRLAAEAAGAGLNKPEVRERLTALVADPQAHLHDPHFAALAAAFLEGARSDDSDVSPAAASLHRRPARENLAKPAQFRIWGKDLDPNSLEQMDNACSLPISVAGALMPDAHLGYGLPIGGVLAVENAVIPYAVGVDIACRMKLSVFDLSPSALENPKEKDRLIRALTQETRFGIGSKFTDRRHHAVLDEDWNFSPITRAEKDKAWGQLGTSGSGNHFVEYGLLTLDHDDLGLRAGVYLALLSHSGSRGTGARIADHYSKVAMSLQPQLEKHLRHLAWLDLDTDAGQEYWHAMELMGRYAAANHALIHRAIAHNLGVAVLAGIENHHNFAWRERHFGREVIVHRKGATPAAVGKVGIVPGSMGAPGYVVRGKGLAESLDSCSHGAGRRMSRAAANRQFRWPDIQRWLDARGITLISAGLDEAPMAYKDIEEVMSAQDDLVERVARFDPKLVKMAPAGERPED